MRAAALALTCLLVAARAHAQSGALLHPALHWSRGPEASSCIDPRTLARRVNTLTSTTLVDAAQADLSIEGHIDRTAAGEFSLRISATDPQGAPRGERLLRRHTESCRELDDAIAFMIALLINPDLALEELPASVVGLGAEGPRPEHTLLADLEQSPPVPAVPENDVPEPSREVAPPAAPPAAPARYALQAGALVHVGELVHTSVGGLLGLEYLLMHWLAIEAQVNVRTMPEPLALDAVRSMRAEAFGETALVCPRYAPHRVLTLDGCAGVDVSTVRAHGAGFSSNRAATATTAAVQLALGATLALVADTSIRVRGFARVASHEPSFQYDRTDGSHQAFTVGRAAAGATMTVRHAF